MSQELIYTSAPKGLKPGTRGFATVAMTQGMPPQLVERLESLSGYRQVFAPQDPQAALNPVVRSHVKLSVGGRSYHVLSRICAAGLDYSQRANKFAHHLALDAAEMPAAGPARALQQRGVMESAWDGATRILPAGRRCPSGNVSPAACRAWQAATGDAGWGGVLAEMAAEKPKSIVTIVFRPGLDPLPLIAESLALLPADVRRTVTFSTYYTKLPPGVECQWRCVLEGSPESKATPGLMINLCRPLPPAQGGVYVALARTGKMPSIAPRARQAPRAERPDDRGLDLLLEPTERSFGQREAAPIAPTFDDLPSLEPLRPALPDDFAFAADRSAPFRRRPRRKEAARWPIFVVVAAVVVIATASIIAWDFSRNGSETTGQVTARTSTTTTRGAENPVADNSQNARCEDRHAGVRPPNSSAKASQAFPANEQQLLKLWIAVRAEVTRATESLAVGSRTIEAKSIRESRRIASAWIAAVAYTERKRLKSAYAAHGLDSLEQAVTVSHNSLGGDVPISLGVIDAATAADCDLSFLGVGAVFGDKTACEIVRDGSTPTDAQKLTKWVCKIDGKPAADFTFSQAGLIFDWRPLAAPSFGAIRRLNQLRNCVLAVKLGRTIGSSCCGRRWRISLNFR